MSDGPAARQLFPGPVLVDMKRNIVFVVDDDPGTLRGLRRLLREYGYDSVLFPSAEAFQNHDDFEAAVCIILDINLNNVRYRVVQVTGTTAGRVRLSYTHNGVVAQGDLTVT